MSSYQYAGRELDVFAPAEQWKRYWSGTVREHLRGCVLEVGAGIGANVPLLLTSQVERMVVLEPDRDLFARLVERVGAEFPEAVTFVHGTLTDLPTNQDFDAVVYIDVLEHIADDAGELAAAAARLRSRGCIIVLAPAHQFLYSEFDRAIGHFRRYDTRSLARLGPAGCRLKKIGYLDSVGLLASVGNALLLRRSTPSTRQILFWDRVLVRLSRVVDRAFGYRLGKTIVAVWERP